MRRAYAYNAKNDKRRRREVLREFRRYRDTLLGAEVVRIGQMVKFYSEYLRCAILPPMPRNR